MPIWRAPSPARARVGGGSGERPVPAVCSARAAVWFAAPAQRGCRMRPRSAGDAGHDREVARQRGSRPRSDRILRARYEPIDGEGHQAARVAAREVAPAFTDPNRVEAPASDTALDADRLEACLGRLAERERLVVLLTFYADRSSREVATELGVQDGNVRVIRHRAIERLRTCMLSRDEVR